MSVETGLTWEALCQAEPRLAALRDEAAAIRADGPTFCASRVYYGWEGSPVPSFKGRLSALVGWDRATAGPDMLFSSDAYSLAVMTILSTLPNCRHTSWVCL